MEALEAHDWIAHARQVEQQLTTAAERLDALESPLDQERRWLEEAQALLASVRAQTEALLPRALRLPGMEDAREEAASARIEPWADAVERLLAGITFHAGPRAPVIEAVFPHKKLESLRRAKLTAARSYAEDLGRRLSSSYVARLLETEDFAFAVPVVEEVKERIAELMPSDEAEPPTGEEAEQLRVDLVQAAQQAEQRVRQARLLAEAALLPAEGVFRELGIQAKPKKRSGKKAEPAAAKAEKPETDDAPAGEVKQEKPSPKKKASSKKAGAAKKKPRSKKGASRPTASA